MKKLLILFLLFSTLSKASSFGSSFELVYIYGTFITLVLLIVGIDRLVKYIHKKIKERNEIFDKQQTANSFEE